MGNNIIDGVKGRGDFCEAQSSANSYQHSMRAWYETKASAESKRGVFLWEYEASARREAAMAREIYSTASTADDVMAAQLHIESAIIQLGKAQHALADETSPAHAGFQVWFGIPDGLLILGVDGYLAFCGIHHARETAAIYNGLGDGPATTVAGQMHSKLLEILQE